MATVGEMLENILRYKKTVNDEYPEYIIINPEVIKSLLKAGHFPTSASTDKHKSFFGVKVIESDIVKDFYLVGKFENQ